MKVGMVVDNAFWGDSRLEKEVLALHKHGVEVVVLCMNHEEAKIEDFKGVKIISKYWNKFLFKKLKGLNNTLINLYPRVWTKWINEFIKEEEITHLHIHDLWMLEAGIKSAKRNKKPIIVDLHENFVFALGNYRYSTTFPGKYIISQKKWERSEKKWLQEVDHVIVVIEEAKERVLELGVPLEKITVAPNYVCVERYGTVDKKIFDELQSRFSGKRTLTYTGAFDLHRGLEIVIKSVPKVLESIPDFHLVLVGDGANKNDLVQLVQELDLAENVSFEGYRPSSELSAYVDSSDICIIPHLKTEHTDKTIPHKLFQYMLMKKPVISSNCIPLERIINEAKCGYVYENDNPNECAKAVIEGFSEDAQQLAENGYNAVHEKYNWDYVSNELVKIYK